MKSMKPNKIEDYITLTLETNSFEEILEKFDISPQEAFLILYNNGHVKEETLVSESDICNYE